MFLLAGNILFKGIDRFFRGIIGDSGNSYWVFGNSCCFLEIRGFYCFFRILSCWDFGILRWKWVSGKGVAPTGWREMRTLLSIFPNPKHPENILQPSRKHITGFQKTHYSPPENILQTSRKNLLSLQKVSFKSPQKASFKSFQQSYSKSPEIHLVPIAKNHDSKIWIRVPILRGIFFFSAVQIFWFWIETSLKSLFSSEKYIRMNVWQSK